MKKYNFYFGAVSIILGLLPLILLRDLSIINLHLTEIVSSLGSLMTITIVLILFGVDQKCLSIIKTQPGLPKQKTDFFTVPMLCIVFFLELILFYLIYPTFFKGQFNYLLGALGSIVTAYVIYIVFGGTYMLMRTHEVEEKVKQPKKD